MKESRQDDLAGSAILGSLFGWMIGVGGIVAIELRFRDGTYTERTGVPLFTSTRAGEL